MSWHPKILLTACIFISVCAVLLQLHVDSSAASHDDRITNYHRVRVERTIRTELRPLGVSLGALGFSNFTKLDTKCGYTTFHKDPHDIGLYLHDDGTYFGCSSGIDRFTRIPTDTAGRQQFIDHAKEFDQALRDNGWGAGANLPWFEKVSQPGNFIANDQTSSKIVGEYTCNINFTTAYSDPDPPAISVQMYCGLEDYKVDTSK